jgi:3',5'-cyclic AMP phosphodiesterase CpdA
MAMQKFYIGVLLIVFTLIFSGCESPFSYSPFEARLAEEFKNTTQKNLVRIASMDTSNNGTFQIALISDPHYHFNKLKDALVDIDNRKDVAFIIVTGDITENGLQKEFELFHQLMAQSRKPFLTVIGNHDYLSNGAAVYQQIFGPLNYSFTFNKVKFVMWDNVVWESNKTPDWDWLQQTLNSSGENGVSRATYSHTIPFSHIPPFDDQVSDKLEVYRDLLRNQNITLSIHGHWHEYSNVQRYDHVNYITIGSPQHRGYALLSVTPDTLTVTKVEY